MSARYLTALFFAAVLISSCVKDDNLPAVPPPPPQVFDTTTVERMEFRWGSSGNYHTLSSVYLFRYDSLYRIRESVLLDYANSSNPVQPDTGFRRQYFYNGSDSLPRKFIYHHKPGQASNFYLDTSYYTYDGAGRLAADSGTGHLDIGYGFWSYYKRVRRYTYPLGDSITWSESRTLLAGLPLGFTGTQTAGFKNIITGNQQIMKYYSSNGSLGTVYTSRYDTFKNPLAKSLLQVIPYFDPNSRDIGDGNITLHPPAPTSRIYYHERPVPGGPVSHEYNCLITYNAQQLPQEIIVQPTRSGLFPYQIKIFY